MFNQLKIQCPSDDFCEYEADDTLIQDLQNFVGLLTSSAEILTKDHPLWTEIKVFQSIQAKYKRILHCDKCLQLLQRVGVYLRKMVLLNLSKSYLDLAEPFLKELQSHRSKRHLPSRQQLEYVLIRTQSAAKLICEALHYSQETFCYLIQRLKVGHMILNLMMATSVTARVNIMFKGILVQIIDSYQKVYLWRNKLKVGKFEWPQPVDLPEDLEEWLKVEDLIQPKQLPTEQLSFLKVIFENQTSKSQNGRDLNVDLENDDDECMIVLDTSQQNESMDLGEVISREEEHADVTSTTQEENPLLQKINEAKNFKHFRDIWENIEEWEAEGALPKKLTSIRIRKINKMFETFQQELNQVKNERLTDVERKTQKKQIRRKYKIKFSRLLHLMPKLSQTTHNSSNDVSHSPEKRKPVKTLNDLVNLYKELYAQLESAKVSKLCRKLQKMFKSRKSDIELLLHNNEEKLAKQLIVCTSKILLAKYVI